MTFISQKKVRMGRTLIKKVTENKSTGKIPRGTNRQRWYDTVEEYLKKVNPPLNMGAVLDRERGVNSFFGAVMVLNEP